MENQNEIKDYADVKAEIKPAFPDAERIDLVIVLNKKITLLDFKAYPSSMADGHEFCVILAEHDSKKVSFNCGEIVLKQLKDIKEKLPVKATITRAKGKRYYTLN